MKKLISRAFMSIFMEKEARDKLENILEAKKGQPDKKATPTATGLADDADPLPKSLKIKKKIATEVVEDSTRIEQKPARTGPPVPSQDRESLIKDALRVQQAQSDKLSNLPPGHRAALQALAMKAFGEGPLAELEQQIKTKKRQKDKP